MPWTPKPSASAATWLAPGDAPHANWPRLKVLIDPDGGVDFVPVVTTRDPPRASSANPIIVYALSTITGPNSPTEGRP